MALNSRLQRLEAAVSELRASVDDVRLGDMPDLGDDVQSIRALRLMLAELGGRLADAARKPPRGQP